MVGADLDLQQQLVDENVAREMSMSMKRVLLDIEEMAVPTIAIINGTALGGGLEIALACDYRVADQECRQIGLPEVKVGVLPGGGGTVRLPRLIGLNAAATMILTARTLDASSALRMGLVSHVFARTQWPSAASRPEWLEELTALWKVRPLPSLTAVTKYPRHWLGNTWAEQRALQWASNRAFASKVNGRFPAPYAALDALLACWNSPYEEAFAIEARAYSKLVVTPEAKSIISLFLGSRRCKKRALACVNGEAEQNESENLKFAVTVVGAGYMGTGITQALLHRGIPTSLVDVSEQQLQSAQEGVRRLFASKGMAEAVIDKKMAGLTPSGSLAEGVQKSMTHSDCQHVVIECATEALPVKQELLRAVEKLDPRAVFATNTSTLMIASVSNDCEKPENAVGLHFFVRQNMVCSTAGARWPRMAGWLTTAVPMSLPRMFLLITIVCRVCLVLTRRTPTSTSRRPWRSSRASLLRPPLSMRWCSSAPDLARQPSAVATRPGLSSTGLLERCIAPLRVSWSWAVPRWGA